MAEEAKSSAETIMSHEMVDVLEEFVAMQQEHAAMLAEGRLKGLSGWVERRRNISLRLRQCLAAFEPGTVPGHSPLAAQIREKMNTILAGEQSLAVQAGRLREEIQGETRIMRKGKTILKGYSLYGGTGPGPKYLSSKT